MWENRREDKNQTKSQSNIRETSTSFTSHENAHMSHIPVTSCIYNLNVFHKPVMMHKIKGEVNQNIKMYHCTPVMAQQNA